MTREWTDDERTEMSRAFSAGNYCNAYETTDLTQALVRFACSDDEHERAAFVLGFFSSYALYEIVVSDRVAFDMAYWSDAGQYVVRVARYCDDRYEEYTAESEELDEA